MLPVDIEQLHENVNTILGSEINEAKLINPKQEEHFKSKMGVASLYSILATPSNLILTEREDFEVLIKTFPKCSIVGRVELLEFNVFLYIVSYVNEYTIKAIMSLKE